MNQFSIKVPIEVSARHIHISRSDLDILFGKDYQLSPIKNLSQKGQFACEETVTIKNQKHKIKELRILGPERPQTQVELTKTDARSLDINPPVAECTSCAGEGGEEVEIIGPKGKIKKHCAIIAHRHIHLSDKQAQKYNLKEGELVSVEIMGDRALTFHQVLIRIDPSFDLHMHLDTDEANAAGITGNHYGKIVK